MSDDSKKRSFFDPKVRLSLSKPSIDSLKLHNAVRSNDQQGVDALIMAGVDLNKRDKEGKTALHAATERTFTYAVRALILADANCNLSDLLGKTALHIAVKRNSGEIVDLLLACGNIDVDKRDGKGRTPLCKAAKRGSVDLVVSLLRAGADYDLADKKGYTPLCYAGRNEHELVIDMLVRVGADTSASKKFLSNYLHEALEAGRQDAVRILLRAGADPDAVHASRSNKRPLHTASESDYRAAVDVLLDADADIDGTDFWQDTPLHVAIRSDCVHMARGLVRHGAAFGKPNYQDETALSLAIRRGLVPVVEDMIAMAKEEKKSRSGLTKLRQEDLDNALLTIISDTSASWPDPGSVVTSLLLLGASHEVKDEYGKRAIHIATCERKLGVLGALLSNGGDPNSTSDVLDRRPIHWAAMFGNGSSRAMINLLLQHEADPNAIDEWGNTALHEATRWCNFEAVELLLESGLSINAKNKQEESPLHTLCRVQREPEYPGECYMDIIDALIQAGGDVNERAADGKTPLHIVAGHTRLNMSDLIRLLVARGAGVDARDDTGKTPLECAAERGVPRNAIYLLELGVDRETLTEALLGRVSRLIDSNPRFTEDDRWQMNLRMRKRLNLQLQYEYGI